MSVLPVPVDGAGPASMAGPYIGHIELRVNGDDEVFTRPPKAFPRFVVSMTSTTFFHPWTPLKPLPSFSPVWVRSVEIFIGAGPYPGAGK